jgi:hypothetical protein
VGGVEGVRKEKGAGKPGALQLDPQFSRSWITS